MNALISSLRFGRSSSTIARILTSAVLTLSAAPMAPAVAAEPSYIVNLGGVNLDAYCKATFGGTFKAVANGPGAGDWSCQRNNNDRRPISVQAACEEQYAARPIKAVAVSPGTATSWRCFKPGPTLPPRPIIRVLGGVNLNAYCSATFGAAFKAVANGPGAGDWSCQQNNNDRRPISVQTACEMQYSERPIRSVALNPAAAGSWVCETP